MIPRHYSTSMHHSYWKCAKSCKCKINSIAPTAHAYAVLGNINNEMLVDMLRTDIAFGSCVSCFESYNVNSLPTSVVC